MGFFRLLACFLHASLTNSSFSDQKKKNFPQVFGKIPGQRGGLPAAPATTHPGGKFLPQARTGERRQPSPPRSGLPRGPAAAWGGCSPASQPEPAGGRLSLRGCGAVNRRQPALRGGQARAPTPPHPALPRPGDPRLVVRERLGRQSGRGRRRKS